MTQPRTKMNLYRVALANLQIPRSPEHSLELAEKAVQEAAHAGAGIMCFPECFVPGYRVALQPARPLDQRFLEEAWRRLAAAAGRAGIAVVLGTERQVGPRRLLTALVINADGSIAGFQDKVQLDPSEETLYAAGEGRRLFRCGSLTFGIVICHEGWRYPETVRWAAQRGAQVVFHPHYDEDAPTAYRASYGEAAGSFHEKAVLCRAAENTCYFATVNCAGAGASTTSAIADPDGTLLAWQPYGQAGLLVADLALDKATGLLARRCRAPYADAAADSA